MSAPPIPYSRQATFTQFATEQFPTTGQGLEAEYNKIAQSIASVIARMREVQRDDGRLMNGLVRLETLSDSVTSLFGARGAVRGAWAAGTAYVLSDIVRAPNGDTYLAAMAHTSTGDFWSDLIAGNWITLDASEAIKGQIETTLEAYGGDATGVLDSATAMADAIASGRPVRLLKDATYKIGSTIPCPNGLELVIEDGATIVGPGGSTVLFSALAAGRVEISGRGSISGFGKLIDFAAGASLDLVRIHDVIYTGTENASAAAVGALISYFSSNVHIKTLDVQNCIVTNGREGVLFRGTWDTARVVNNTLRGVQHYSIRLGQDRDAADWDLQGYALVCGNDIRGIRNPVTGSGSNECNGIAVFSKSANIFGNFIEDVDGGGVDDIEGIYTKVQHGNIYGNILVDACRREGAIVVKTAPRKPGTDYDQVNTINVFGNIVWFELARSHEAGISIQSSNVNCYGNFVYAGAAITAESAGIVIKYRSPYRNITIRDNHIYTPAFGYGILAWAYGENVVIKDNFIWGCGNRGIQLETRASSDVRYPTSTPIGKNYVVEGNQINSEAIGSRSGIDRGISVTINSAAPVTGLMIRNNTLTGPFVEYRVALTGSGSSNWRFEGNDISNATGTVLLLGTPPTGFWIRSNPGLVTRARGTDTVGSGTSTQTVTNSIGPVLGAYLTTADITLSPLSANFHARQVYVDSIFSSGNFQVNTGNTGGNATFKWEASLEDRSLT